jgi:hypothetical protein
MTFVSTVAKWLFDATGVSVFQLLNSSLDEDTKLALTSDSDGRQGFQVLAQRTWIVFCRSIGCKLSEDGGSRPILRLIAQHLAHLPQPVYKSFMSMLHTIERGLPCPPGSTMDAPVALHRRLLAEQSVIDAGRLDYDPSLEDFVNIYSFAQ